MNEKRDFLKRQSLEIIPQVEQGIFKSINQGLISLYERSGYPNLKTAEAWQNLGYRMNKGAEAVYIWGKKIEKAIEENGTLKNISFCPLLPVFSELQVYKSNN